VSYQVIARKWRPQSFQDLVGQEHVSQTLLNALRHDRLPQALLFTGVRGTGKTSSARILAKSLRCPNAKDFVPCGVCSECEDVANSRSLDVIEIDGASNNGVDAIRELRETVGYMPSSGRYKVYIIDEVHMLSTSAFNALLKTLEEPPAHVVFIMATTEAQKIPSTILSRCQRFDFRRIPSRQIASQLAKICEAEGVKTEGEALWLLARQADGSMRDSQSLLDQVITFCSGEVTLQKVIDVLGLTDRSLLLETLESLVRRDTQKAVDVIEKIFKSGYDPKVFAQDLLEEIRNALLVRLSPDDPSRVVDLPDTEIESLRELTASLTDEDLHLLFDMTLKGVNDLLRSQDARIVLEMLLLRMAAAPRIASLAALASGQVMFQPAPAVSTQSHEASQAAPSATAKAHYSMASFTRPASGVSGAPATPPAGAKTPQPAPSAAPAANTQPAAQIPAQQAPAEAEEPSRAVDAAKANDPWYRFVERVKKANSLLGAMLENTHLISAEGSQLTIGVPKKMSFMFDKVKEPENVARIQSFLETFWNKKYDVQVKLADEKADKTTPKAMADEHRQAQKRSLEQAVEQNPLVQTAQNVFKAQIKSIKDAGSQAAAKSGADGQSGTTSTKGETT
jgi:DNA polymerase III subunit gamma/tau